MMKAFTIGAVAMAVALLGGCASTFNSQQQAKLDAADRLTGADALVQNRIAESASSIASTLQLIERIERGSPTSRVLGAGLDPRAAGVPAQMGGATAQASTAVSPFASGQPAGVSPELSAAPRTAVTSNATPLATGVVQDLLDSRLRIVWKNGPAEDLLRTLAQKMGVPFKISGEKRDLGPVSVVSENESMGSILASVGKQVDRGADIVYNKNQQPFVLELRYK